MNLEPINPYNLIKQLQQENDELKKENDELKEKLESENE